MVCWVGARPRPGPRLPPLEGGGGLPCNGQRVVLPSARKSPVNACRSNGSLGAHTCGQGCGLGDWGMRAQMHACDAPMCPADVANVLTCPCAQFAMCLHGRCRLHQSSAPSMMQSVSWARMWALVRTSLASGRGLGAGVRARPSRQLLAPPTGPVNLLPKYSIFSVIVGSRSSCRCTNSNQIVLKQFVKRARRAACHPRTRALVSITVYIEKHLYGDEFMCTGSGPQQRVTTTLATR